MEPLIHTLGGVGLFLFGMATMTSGLRKLAGDNLRKTLQASTKNTFSGIVTGAVVTALVQSSSATTVAAIGFVGAGLITFTQSLGIIFGANIGTTITGWMVALIGFKMKLGVAALPLFFIAAVCYLIKKSPKTKASGKALAGFCLIFLGISYLQEGLGGYKDLIDFSDWSIDSLGGRMLLVLVGIAFTLMAQSSSATVATAITALNTGIIDLPQTAAVIIGADIGTTVTAVIATIGGSTASRRTGFAHLFYNLLTGLVAFLILPLYLWAFDKYSPGAAVNLPEMVAVAFHSFFNMIGVVVILPFTKSFGKFIEKVFPSREFALEAPFSSELLKDPHTAMASLESGTKGLAVAALENAKKIFAPGAEPSRIPHGSLDDIIKTAATGRHFALQIASAGNEGDEIHSGRLLSCINALDHVGRFAKRSLNSYHIKGVLAHSLLAGKTGAVHDGIEGLGQGIPMESQLEEATGNLALISDDLAEDKIQFRDYVIRQAAKGELGGAQLDEALNAHRWLRRLCFNASKIGFFLGELQNPKPPAE